MMGSKKSPVPVADFQVTMLNFKNFPSRKNAQQQDPASEDVPPQAAEIMLGDQK